MEINDVFLVATSIGGLLGTFFYVKDISKQTTRIKLSIAVIFFIVAIFIAWFSITSKIESLTSNMSEIKDIKVNGATKDIAGKISSVEMDIESLKKRIPLIDTKISSETEDRGAETKRLKALLDGARNDYLKSVNDLSDEIGRIKISLEKIQKDFDKKIDSVKAHVSQAKPMEPALGSGQGVPRQENAQSRGVSLDVHPGTYFSAEGCKVSKLNDGVSLSFILKNKSSNDLMIALLSDSASIRDTSGKNFQCITLNGMGDIANKNDDYKPKYTVIGPNGSKIISMTFRADRFNGDGVDFSATILRLADNGVAEHTIGTTGLIVR